MEILLQAFIDEVHVLGRLDKVSICVLIAHELLTKARLILTSTQPDRRNAIACMQPYRTISTILREVILLQV